MTGTLDYDPLGRLKQTTFTGATTLFLYDGDRLTAEYDGTGTLLRRYVHGPGVDEPIVWYEGATLTTKRWLHSDERGSVVTTTDAAGTVTGYSYGPYGEQPTWTGSRFRYTGQIMLPEAQLYYYKARILDPNHGRFLQTDPIGYDDQLNLYAYVGNDPLNNTDPKGLYVCSGSDANCAKMATFVSSISAAAKNLDPNSDAYKKVDAAVKYLGAPGERNGAYITASRIEGEALATAGPGGNIVIDTKEIASFSSKLEARNPGTSGDRVQNAVGAGAIGHEARHELDAKKNGWAHRPLPTLTPVDAAATYPPKSTSLLPHTGRHAPQQVAGIARNPRPTSAEYAVIRPRRR